jgi:hypothetical protein
MKGNKNLRKKAVQYLTTDVWRVNLAERTAVMSLLIRQLRVILLTLRGFDQDRCSVR